MKKNNIKELKEDILTKENKIRYLNDQRDDLINILNERDKEIKNLKDSLNDYKRKLNFFIELSKIIGNKYE